MFTYIDFLEMIVSIVSIRQIHQSRGYQATQFEELLLFGSKSISNLLTKIEQPTDALIDKIFQLFLLISNIRVREQLCKGLSAALKKLKESPISEGVLDGLVRLTKLKRG